MSLRDRLRESDEPSAVDRLYERFGVVANPFPASNQTSANPRRPLPADEQAELSIVTFVRDRRSQVVVISGTQGVGKTNFLNHFESEIRDVMADRGGYYLVRYLADPEASFEGTTRRLFEELGMERLHALIEKLRDDRSPIDEEVRSHDMRTALYHLIRADQPPLDLMLQWLLGLRVLKAHRQALGVQFRLDTVESKTAALRDIVQVSGRAGVLDGIFLLLDELEKQDGVLGPTAVVRYLSAVRSVVDALPERLFLMIGITPDALRRYSAALPALRGRLQNQIELEPLRDAEEAWQLARFYMESARRSAEREGRPSVGGEWIVARDEAIDHFDRLYGRATRRGDDGVRQRQFLHELHVRAERVIQDGG